MKASPLHAAQQQDEENRDDNVENGIIKGLEELSFLTIIY